MPIKCHFCENNTHSGPVEKCERVFITRDEALSLLAYSDEGAIAIQIFVQDKTVMIDFGKELSCLGMDKFQAIALAKTILDKANSIEVK